MTSFRVAATSAAALCTVVLCALGAASCGPSKESVRLRHEPKRAFVYELTQHEEAEHPTVGLGGSLDVGASLRLACISAGADGAGDYEATLRHVWLAAPPSTGAALDTRAGRPAEGDRIGASAVVQSLLPRTAIVSIAPDCAVGRVQPDPVVREHMSRWFQNKPVASRRAIVRIGEVLDVGPLVARWFTAVAAILPRQPVVHGDTWRVELPAIETPAGDFVATMDLVCRREGVLTVVEGRGAFAAAGAAPENRLVDFDTGSLDMSARLDVARGVLVAYEESGEFTFRMREANRTLAPWRHRRKLKLVE